MDTSVATVTQDGLLTAVDQGTTTLIATITVGEDSYMDSCSITVNEPTPAATET